MLSVGFGLMQVGFGFGKLGLNRWNESLIRVQSRRRV
jgi:hypothetical protein